MAFEAGNQIEGEIEGNVNANIQTEGDRMA